MAKLHKTNGATSNILRVKIMDSTSTTGAGKTGLTEASAGLIIGTIADNEATTTRYRASSTEIETITTLGTFAAPTSGKCRFKEVDPTNHPGLYEVQLADARFAVSAAKALIVTLSGATGMAQVDAEVQLEPAPADVRQLLGTAWLTPGTAGTPDVNVKLWNALTTVELPLVPTTAGRKLDVSTGGEAGVDWANVGSPTTSLNLSGTTIATTQKVDVETIKTQAVTAAAGVTFPTSIASPTNITAGTITTATNLTNAPTAGDFTAAMKTSIGTAVAASAVASVTGNVGGNVVGSVGSVVGLTASDVGAIKTKTDSLTFTVPGMVDSNVVDWKGATAPAMTGDAFARLGAPAGASVSADIADLPTNAELATALGTADDATLAAIAALSIPTAADMADAVWDEAIAGHAVAGSTGEALTNADSSGISVPTALQNADALLNRDMSAVSDTESRSPLNAFRFIRNGFGIVGATLTVLKEDDSTPAYTRTLTTDAAAVPIVGVD